MKKIALIIFALLLAWVTPSANATVKVGTTSMQTLKLPYGVRGIGMGNAGVATAVGAEAIWWNPGALTEICGTDALVSQINMPADVQLNSFALAKKWGDHSAVSLHAINMYTDDMPVRTVDQPEGTGEFFNTSDFALGGSYARQLTDKFSLGGNVRYIRTALEESTYNGVTIDLGTLYKTSLRSLRVAMAIQNLGPNVQYSGTYQDSRNRVRNGGDLLEVEYDDASLPTLFRLGAAFDVFDMLKLNRPQDQGILFSVEMNHPNDNRERLNVGGEWNWKETFFARAGGKFGYDEESFSAGFGLHVPVGSYGLKFDYAYSHWDQISAAADGFADQSHRMQIGFDWCRDHAPKAEAPRQAPKPKAEPAPTPKPVPTPEPKPAPIPDPVPPPPPAPSSPPDTAGMAQREMKAAMEIDRAKLLPIYFNLDKSNIRPDQEATMNANISILKKWTAWKVELTGNTDLRATPEYNRALSLRRCESVKSAMIKAGISADRFVEYVVKGEETPVAGGDDEAAHQRNRRVDVIVK